MPWYQLLATPDELITRFYSGPPRDTPGRSFSYKNADYIVLGRIIEKVTGQAFGQVLAARILSPLGMTNTGMLRQSEIVPRLAPAYFTLDGRLVNDLPAYPENWFAAAACIPRWTTCSVSPGPFMAASCSRNPRWTPCRRPARTITGRACGSRTGNSAVNIIAASTGPAASWRQRVLPSLQMDMAGRRPWLISLSRPTSARRTWTHSHGMSGSRDVGRQLPGRSNPPR
jgi:CubicO group peptidase (beta-lactamase class C family)